jgi:hypothetical protein
MYCWIYENTHEMGIFKEVATSVCRMTQVTK